MRWICLALVVLIAACSEPAPPVSRALPLAQVQFFNFPPQKSKQDPGTWGPILTDIENHLPASYGSQYYHSNPAIHAHETTHGINAHIRNTYGNPGDNGFYVLQDRAIVLPEPAMTKSKVAAFVPAGLRGSRFSLYITGQTAWDNEPLYVFDEWVAYTNDSEVGVQLHNSGLWTYGWTDGVAGTLEFCAYSTATAMAIEQHDPGYFGQNPQFLAFFAWQLQRAMDIFRAGKDLKDFTYAKQDAYYQELQSGAGAAPLRAFLTQRFGKPFMEQVLGLAPSPPPAPDSGAPPPAPDSGAPPPPPDSDSGAPPPLLDSGAPPATDSGQPGGEAGVNPVIPPRIGPRASDGLQSGCSLGRGAGGLPLSLLLLLGAACARLTSGSGRRRSPWGRPRRSIR